MANTIKPRPLEPLMDEFQRMGFSEYAQRAFRDMLTRMDKVLTDKGEVQSVANVTGRTEQLSSTLQNVTSAGQLNSLANVVNTNTDLLTDGTGSPLTGGKRGFIALTSISGAIRIADSGKQVPVSLNGAFNGSNPLTQHALTTQIDVASWQMQFGNGFAGGNSGSVDPGSFGTFYVYIDMPVLTIFIGGATYFATANVFDLTANEGRICLGKITTSGGGGGTGSGTGGGGKTGIMQVV